MSMGIAQLAAPVDLRSRVVNTPGPLDPTSLTTIRRVSIPGLDHDNWGSRPWSSSACPQRGHTARSATAVLYPH